MVRQQKPNLTANIRQVGKIASDMLVRSKQICIIEFFHAEKLVPIDINRRLLNVYGEQTVHFSRDDRDVREKVGHLDMQTAAGDYNKIIIVFVVVNLLYAIVSLCSQYLL